MIITKLSGKLGNQMFQYALALNLALKNHTEIVFDLNEKNWQYCLHAFNIPYRKASLLEVERYTFKPTRRLNYFYRKFKNFLNPHLVLREKQFSFEENVVSQKSKNIYLEGFWQSEKYFSNIKDVILEKFSLNVSFPENIKIIAEDIVKHNSVSVHVRRGDYLKPENAKKYTALNLEYYSKGLEMIASGNNDLKVFVFSDDIDWCKKNMHFGYPTVFMDYPFSDLKPLYDLKLMSMCRHQVIANSTFSWWAAWLNKNPGKIVVAPEQWFADAEFQSKAQDIIPEEWIKI